jgi:hypothetical protein
MILELNDQAGTLTARWGAEAETFALTEDLAPVVRHLTLLGLRTYLRERTMETGDARLDGMRAAFDELRTRGRAVFERRMPKLPAVSKDDKIAALASLLGAAPSVVRARLALRDDADAILNDPKVLALAEELRLKEVDL